MKYKRKAHPKSQGGCTRCKLRHVKCDEQEPCTNCLKRNEECIIGRTDTKRSCARCEIKKITPVKELTLDWTREIYLMHHFSTVTASSLSLGDPEVESVWKAVIPELAVGHPYLMNGILALSALHLAQLRPQEQAIWAQPAFRYQNRAINALNMMLPYLTEQKETNAHAIFAVGVTLSMSSMAVTKFSIPLNPEHPFLVSDVISPVMHIRGVQQVCNASGQFILSGSLAPLLRTGMDECPLPSKRPPPIFGQLNCLRHRFRQEKSQAAQICMLGTLQVLETIYAEVDYLVQKKNENWYPGLVWKWPSMLSQEYVGHLQANDPSALVIFAHFAVLSLLFDEWYLSGWPMRAILSISDALPVAWRGLLCWPEDQLNNGLIGMRATDDKLDGIEEG